MTRTKRDSVVGVYMIHNQETGEAYIGSGVLNARRNQHFSLLRNNSHGNKRFQDAYNKNPKFEFVGVNVEGATKEEARIEALVLEATLISEHNSPLLLNLMRGNVVDNTCLSHSVDTREKISQHKKKSWDDPAWRAKTIAAQNAGRAALTDAERAEYARIQSAAQKARYERMGFCPTKGQTRSEEFKQQDSQKITALWQDPDYRARQMAARVNGPGNQRPVVVDGIEYQSMTHAANAHGITPSGALYKLKAVGFPNWQFKE